MPKRRKLPAPPLVLTPYLLRLSSQSDLAPKLLELACFLQMRGLLTGGGERSLQEGLRGRNGVVSLSLQDVRACAHGLVVEIMQAGEWDQISWMERWECYFQRYDRGKPRRPTHLQRMYLEWSGDLTWRGLLKACREHPRLWPELQLAWERFEEPGEEKFLLQMALSSRENLDCWLQAFEEKEGPERALLLDLLPLLSPAMPSWRVPFLAREVAQRADIWEPSQAFSLIKACHCGYRESVELRRVDFPREALEGLALRCFDQGSLDAIFLGAFRSFVSCRETIDLMLQKIPPDEPLRRVSFGSRPGLNWLQALEQELRRLIELR